MPYMPPPQAYDGQGSPQAGGVPGSRVEHRRNADGSMSISIGGGSGNGNGGGSNSSGAGNGGGEEQSSMNISDVSHLLLYDNGEEGEGQGHESEQVDEGPNKDEV